MKMVCIIGIGMSPRDLTREHLERIKNADLLVGGRRHLDYFKDYPMPKKEITKGLKGLIQYIRSEAQVKAIVVLASGDPLYYGIGPLLINALGPENVSIYPNVTSVAAAFARIKESWQDVRVISIHGRLDEEALLQAIGRNGKVAVFTDPVKNPTWLADFMIAKGRTDFDICVLEQLGTPAERVNWYSLSQAAGMQFSEPNLVVLKRKSSLPAEIPTLYFGMPDEMYDHQKGLITKAEVRIVSLAKLRLLPHHVLWDLGAGSGSVGIEASLFVRSGSIFALEQRAERVEQIKTNRARFGVKNLEVIEAVLPDGLANLPPPDRIFIGGGGRNLEEIIRRAAPCLKPQGIMVINTVLIQNFQVALKALRDCGFATDFIQIQINRARNMPWGARLDAQNPVWIITGERNQG